MNNSHLNIKGADVALRIEQMLQELITCIQAETHALRAHDKKASTTHLKKKKALLLRYQSLHSELSESTKDIDMSGNTPFDQNFRKSAPSRCPRKSTLRCARSICAKTITTFFYAIQTERNVLSINSNKIRNERL
jgi:hypothetical protein